MITWKEKKLKFDVDKVIVPEEYKDFCDKCESDIACEDCDVFIPLECEPDAISFEEITMGLMTICGIPVGNPYEVKESEEE